MEQVAYKAIAFLSSLEQQDVDALPPARRRQLADLCQHWAKRAEPPSPAPRSGILGELRNGAAATD